MSEKFYKTSQLPDNLNANRAREYTLVLNPQAVLTEKSECSEEGGQWSHTLKTYYYREPLYIIRYSHSTHPEPGVYSFIIYNEGRESFKKTVYTNVDYITLPEQFKRFVKEIDEFVSEKTPRLYERTIALMGGIEVEEGQP